MNTDLAEFSTLSSIANLIRRALRQYAVDIIPILEAAKIELLSLTNPDARFSVKQMQSLWKLSAKASQDPCFGIEVGMQIQPTALHGLGFAWLASDTLRNSLQRLVKFSSLISTFATFTLDEGDKNTTLTFSGAAKKPQLIPETCDFYVSALLRMCEITAPNYLKPLHIYTTRPTPEEILRRRYDQLCQCPISYNAENIRIVFDNQMLDRPLTSPNPSLARLNDEIVEQYLSQYLSDSLRLKVTQAIINRLPSGPPNADSVAKTLNVSRRTLHRKLAEENTDFRTLLNDVRRQLALKYIKEPNRSLSETAYLLGFSEPGNFSRAFNRWFGKSPSQYRQARQI